MCNLLFSFYFKLKLLLVDLLVLFNLVFCLDCGFVFLCTRLVGGLLYWLRVQADRLSFSCCFMLWCLWGLVSICALLAFGWCVLVCFAVEVVLYCLLLLLMFWISLGVF